MPVNGNAKIKSENTIIIEPKGENFKNFEIIISNIKAVASLNHAFRFLGAGTVIGNVRMLHCEKYFIHLSVRYKSSETEDKNKRYTDPTSFLHGFIPVPRWTEYCREFEYKTIGSITDIGNLGKGLQKVFIEQVRKNVEKWNKLQENFKENIIDALYSYPKKDLAKNFKVNPYFKLKKPKTKISFDFSSFSNIFGNFTQIFSDVDG